MHSFLSAFINAELCRCTKANHLLPKQCAVHLIWQQYGYSQCIVPIMELFQAICSISLSLSQKLFCCPELKQMIQQQSKISHCSFLEFCFVPFTALFLTKAIGQTLSWLFRIRMGDSLEIKNFTLFLTRIILYYLQHFS